MGRYEEFGDKRHEPCANDNFDRRCVSFAVALAIEWNWFDVLAWSFLSHEAEQSFHEVGRRGFFALFKLLDHAHLEAVHVMTVLVFDDESWKIFERRSFTAKVLSHRVVHAILESFLSVGEALGSLLGDKH